MLPMPSQISLVWKNLSPTAGEKILKTLSRHNLEDDFTWPGDAKKQSWDVKNYSFSRSTDKEGEEMYSIKATLI